MKIVNIGETVIVMNSLLLPQFGLWPAEGAGTVAVAPPGLGEHTRKWLARAQHVFLLSPIIELLLGASQDV